VDSPWTLEAMIMDVQDEILDLSMRVIFLGIYKP
jgi:hypothetical protein